MSKRILITALAVLTVISINAQVSFFSSVKSFTTPTPAMGEAYGSCVDMYENFTIVGAPESMVTENGKTCKCGAAYVIENDPVTNTPVNQIPLVVPGLTEQDLYGSYVSIWGDFAVVGAPGKTVGKKSSGPSGVVYVFNKTSTENWNLVQTISSTDICQDCEFGTAVSLTQNWLAVGATCSTTTTNPSNTGSAFVFMLDQSNSTFTNPQKLTAPKSVVGDAFAYCVDICDNVCVVGAPTADVVTNSGVVADAGCAYVYTLDNNVWTCTETVFAENCKSNDRFAETVCVTPTSVVVGCSNYCFDATASNYVKNSGAAFVYECNSTCTAWEQSCVITPSVRVENGNFGCSVACANEYIVVGANYNCETVTSTSASSATWTPSAFVYTCDPSVSNSTYTEVCNVIPTTTVSKTTISPVVAISSNKQIAIGEPYTCKAENPSTTCGVVEVFEACYTTAQVRVNGNTLQCMTNCDSYQWMEYTAKGYMPISGATGPYFTPSKNGVYCVKVTENDFCSNISACINMNVDAVPTGAVGTTTDAMRAWAIEVIDLNGQTLMYEPINTTNTGIEFNTLKEGTYLLKVVTNPEGTTAPSVRPVKVKN
jgi:hypothetical protein